MTGLLQEVVPTDGRGEEGGGRVEMDGRDVGVVEYSTTDGRRYDYALHSADQPLDAVS